MPKIRHWHNVSHDFNRDPEVRELRRRFGDWMALVWLEMLSIADRNDGKVPGELSLIAESLSHVSLTKYRGTAVKTIRIAFEFMLNCGWIVVENPSNLSRKPEEKAMIRIINYVKYKNTRDANKNPTGNATAPLLTYPNQPNLLKKGEDKSQTSPSSQKPKPEIPTEAIALSQLLSDRIAENFPQRTALTEVQMMEWAREAERLQRIDGHPWEQIRELLEWSQADSFWRRNILSMQKFRKQWNQLDAKRTDGGNPRNEKQEALRQQTRDLLSKPLPK